MSWSSFASRALLITLLMLGMGDRLAPAVAADVAIVGAKVYPSADAAPLTDAVVLIRDGAIVAVGTRQRIAVPAGFQLIDARGGVLVAGLWNCHVHLVADGLLNPDSLSDADLSSTLQRMFVQWGFTTVFDLASTMKSAGAIRERIGQGRVPGPRVLTVGEPFFPQAGTPVYAKPIYEQWHLPSAEIKDATQARQRVERQVKEGADGIKLFTAAIQAGNSPSVYMAAQEVRAITSQAHRLHKPTFAHPTDAEGVEIAIDNGVDILAHVAPLSGPWSTRFVAKLRARKIGLIPTLMLFDVFPDPRTPVDVGIQQVAAQARAGGDILFGTDAGFMEVYDPTREYVLMNRAMSWQEILASLTTTPARRFGFAERLGRIKAGFLADLTLLDADPAADIAAFARVRMVFRSGEPIYSKP